MKMTSDVFEKIKIDKTLLDERQEELEDFMIEEMSNQIYEYIKPLINELEIYKKALDWLSIEFKECSDLTETTYVESAEVIKAVAIEQAKEEIEK